MVQMCVSRQQRNAPMIITARLTSNSLIMGDLKNFVRIDSNARAAPMTLRAIPPWLPEDAAVVLMQSVYAVHRRYRLKVFNKEKHFVGCFGLDLDANIAHFFDPHSWGQGIETAAVRAFVSDCFDHFGFTEIHADRFHGEHASKHALCKMDIAETGKRLGTPALPENEEQIIK